VGADAIAGTVIDWGVAARPLPGEARSGDAHVVEPFPGGVLVAAVDGLGHGDEAADAAATAVGILTRCAGEGPVGLLERCHEGLRESRGAAISVASIGWEERKMSWLGVGNVEGSFVRADPSARPARESLLLRGGVVGFRLPRLVASVVDVGPADTLLLTTDGIAGPPFEGIRMSDPPAAIADAILAGLARSTDDALALVARCPGDLP
jgi:hypothetical protein